MTKLAVFLAVAFVSACTGLAYAQEPTVVESPTNAFEKVKAVVDVLDPQVESFLNFENGEWSPVFSGAIFKLDSNEIHLASIRAGYGLEKTLLGGVRVDVFGIGKRFLPDPVKDVINKGTPTVIKNLARDHTAVGFAAGYDWSENEPAYGATFGARFSF